MSAERTCECRKPDCHACELAGVKGWLAAQGLHVVTAADKAVLEAMGDIPEQDLRDIVDAPPPSQRQAVYRSVVALCRAELARREQKA